MQWITEVSGFLASITGFLVWLPQARRVWQDRKDPTKLAGVSLQTQALSLAGNVLWLVHAVGIGSFWLGAPSVVNIPVIVLTIALVRRASTRALVDEGLQALVPAETVPALAEVPVLEAVLCADPAQREPVTPEVVAEVVAAAAAETPSEDFAQAV